MIKRSKKVYFVMFLIITILVLVLGYFFVPKTFKKDITFTRIEKNVGGITYTYDLNKQENRNFGEIIKKSKFYFGVAWPERTFADKLVSVHVITGSGAILISIYFDDNNKTYVSSNVYNTIFNDSCRISNNVEIINYVKNILTTKSSEFKLE